MKKTILSILLFCSTIFAEVTNIEVTEEYVESKQVKIIDIRTESEWKKMGVIPHAHFITFFGEDKAYNIKSFLKELDALIEKDEEFAIISNSSSRTKLVSNFLGNKHQYKVVNLIGGMSKLLEEGYKVEAYTVKRKKEKDFLSLVPESTELIILETNTTE